MRLSRGRSVSAPLMASRSGQPARGPVVGSVRTVERKPAVRWSLDTRVFERERVLRGWTRAELARVANVDEKTLRDMLSTRRRPTFGTVQAVCIALGLTLPKVIVFPDEGN